MISTLQGDESFKVPSFRLDGRLAAIFGASEGIGQSIALAFAMSGARLALISRDVQRLSKTIMDIQPIQIEAECYEADISKVEDLKKLTLSIRKKQGPVSILVNSAGFPLTKLANKVNEEDWDKVIDVGLKGIFFSCQAFFSTMADQGYGKIINLNSTYSSSVAEGKSVYAICKAGVLHLTRALALEWAPFGIRVNGIAPTLTATPSRISIFDDEERVKSIIARIPLGRYANTLDLIGSALFLASEASDFITGHTLFVDGGWKASR